MFENLFQKYVTAKNVVFFIIFLLFMLFIIKVLDIAIMFFASFVIACSLEPLVQKLSVKMPRSSASAVVLCSSILLILLFFVPIFLIGGHQILNFGNSFPQYIEMLKDYINGSPFFKHVDISGIITTASGMTSQFIGQTLEAGKNIGSAFVYLLVSLLIIYYFMADKDLVKKTFLRLIPVPMRKKTSEIYDTISEKIGRYVIAQVITMSSVGIIMTLGLLILKVDYALLLGFITGLFDIVPIVGPAVALLVALIVVYKSGPIIMLLTAVVFCIAQLVENNFVRPYIFGKFLNIHPLLIYLFLFIAAKYIGIIGVVFAPAIAATFVVLLEEIYIKNLE